MINKRAINLVKNNDEKIKDIAIDRLWYYINPLNNRENKLQGCGFFCLYILQKNVRKSIDSFL